MIGSGLMKISCSAILTRGETHFVALCPELGVVSQGKSEKSALKNLKEAIELYLEDEDVKKNLSQKPFEKAKITTMTISA
jgi:predicted RNase H-like HicB family nuclease